MASNLTVMDSNLTAMASNLLAMASHLLATGGGLQPTSNGLQPTSDGLQPLEAMASNLLAMASNMFQPTRKQQNMPEFLGRRLQFLSPWFGSQGTEEGIGGYQMASLCIQNIILPRIPTHGSQRTLRILDYITTPGHHLFNGLGKLGRLACILHTSWPLGNLSPLMLFAQAKPVEEIV